MYEHEGLGDALFMALYGAVAMMALLGGGRPGWMVLYQMVVIILFLSGYVRALRQYGRWLRNNYADLEHKEVWQSLVVILVIVVVYGFYMTNGGSLLREYLSQLNSVLIIAFVVWRVEARVEGRSATATQLSAECGYGTYRTFADAFRTQKGQTPTEWMRSQTD